MSWMGTHRSYRGTSEIVMADKQLLLDQIAADIVANNVCPDLAKQATQLVMGDGTPDADIVFIGEAPGRNEDEQGLPFVGASGKILNEMLATIGLQRADVYITNIVKYRPPKNRDPLPAEKQAFWPYLLRQLAVIEPRLVVTLGRHSMEYFLPGQIIGDVHGQQQIVVIEGKGTGKQAYTVMPVYHPSATIYNRKLRPLLQDDFTKLQTIINQ